MKLRSGRRVSQRASKSQGAKALAKVKKLAKSLKPEVKVFDAGASPNVSTTGSVTDLCIPSQGDTYINRSGIKINPKSLLLRAHLVQSTVAVNTTVRVILFRGMREGGTAFAVTDILQQATMDSPLVWLTRDRFTLISDRCYTLNDTNNTSIMVINRHSLKKALTFNGNSTTIQDGGVYMLLLSNEATNTPLFDWYTRVTFTDV